MPGHTCVPAAHVTLPQLSWTNLCEALLHDFCEALSEVGFHWCPGDIRVHTVLNFDVDFDFNVKKAICAILLRIFENHGFSDCRSRLLALVPVRLWQGALGENFEISKNPLFYCEFSFFDVEFGFRGKNQPCMHPYIVHARLFLDAPSRGPSRGPLLSWFISYLGLTFVSSPPRFL